MVPIESIRPYDNNPRRHDEISEIVESIQRVGFRGSIWVDKDMEIIAGHGRYLSALQLGMKEVPVTIMDDLTEAEVKYLRIKDNKAFEGSEWDYEAYARELDELKDLDFDTSDIEFETDLEDEIHDEGYGEEFSLPSGDKPDECTISFTLSVMQEELVRDTLNSVDISEYSLGPSMDKSKIQPLVKGTKWNEFIELNRMAFDDELPKNAESRCIAQAMRMLRKNAPHIKWVISFADGTQCGDGTIYRASGFYLVGISRNKTILEFPNGDRIANMTLTSNYPNPTHIKVCKDLGVPLKYRTDKDYIKLGAKMVDGFMLKYVYFLDKESKDNLTVPILPYSEIDRIGARMYKGKKYKYEPNGIKECVYSDMSNTSDNQSEKGGANPTYAHHSSEDTSEGEL